MKDNEFTLKPLLLAIRVALYAPRILARKQP